MTAAANPYLGLDQDARLDALEELQREKARLAAKEVFLLHAMFVDPPSVELEPRRRGEDKQWVREQVACSLRVAPCTAAGRLVTAEHLVTQLPGTLALLAAGSISFAHVMRICEATYGFDVETYAEVEAVVLPNAADQSAAQFRVSVVKAAARFDTRASVERHEAAVGQRQVLFFPQPDGVTDLIAPNLPADAAAAIRDRVHRLAAQAKGRDGSDERTADQRRADTFIDLLLDAVPATARTAPTPDDAAAPAADAAARGSASQGAVVPEIAPTVHVTVALSTLLGLDEQGGELTGHGPIPAQLARALAFDPNGTWRRILIDTHGRFLDAGAHTYRPAAALDRHLRLRDQTCRFPGCRRPAQRCDRDHLCPWADGGPTTEANTHLLCKRHHHLKHETRWRVHRHPDGWTAWTNPTGRRYRQPPPDPLPLDTTFTVTEIETPAPF